MSAPSAVTDQDRLDPPPVDDDGDGDGGDDGGSGGWWAASPPWAKVVVAAGLALLLVAVGVIGGIALGRSTAESYGPAEGSIDVGFLQDMTVHHGQAVEMAVWARNNTADPQVRQIAFDIESTQTAQVGRMEGWLTLWGRPLSPPAGQYMAWMGMPTATMPGMASPEDLARLRAATGRELDVVFLQLMLRHHQGGLPMMQAGAADASVPAVRALAQSMVASQSAESATMTQMLAERGTTPLPAPADPHAGMHGTHGG
ncbi:DUF305 domain-containing protein [Actinomycetospora lemnae]|uniref:DUF305 domain-containing protein n=1 Tax=Actinomycetospora lemnae TaxID=3019891 RepID=A0ABT5SXY1_9PSEU|nr:DUF305 domain-containing protein [Actinomycetospora sp. DW7H6]MDD7967725.1 DUF305 domain-containing protein [Actinomycetospora sp. DW7H6]